MKRELELLYEECAQQLFTCALAITRCPSLAQDAIHNAFLRLIKSNSKPDQLKGYVFRCVRNAAIDAIRKQQREKPLDSYIFEPFDDPRGDLEKQEFQQRVLHSLQDLSEDERETIVQHLFADLTFREIGEIREISINTVMSWYRRGIEKMKDRLEVVHERP